MLCQMCLRARAMVHVVDRDGGQDDYCQACYDIRYVHPPDRPVDFPRPRFTIRRLMILAAVFAVMNGGVMIAMRSGLVTSTPAQMRDWTFRAFVFGNGLVGLFALWFVALRWFEKVEWHKRTGGVIPMPPPVKLGPRRYAAVLSFAIVRALIVVACLFGIRLAFDRLAAWLLPDWHPGASLSLLIVMAPLYVWFGLRIASMPRVRAVWRAASPLERFLRAMGALWLLVFLVILVRPGPLWSADPLIFLGTMMVVFFGGQMMILMAVALVARRR